MLGALLWATRRKRKPNAQFTRTAWQRLLAHHRSECIGWSKSGEFYCPHCSTIIGKNLIGESPFFPEAEHLRTHSGMGRGGAK